MQLHYASQSPMHAEYSHTYSTTKAIYTMSIPAFLSVSPAPITGPQLVEIHRGSATSLCPPPTPTPFLPAILTSLPALS